MHTENGREFALLKLRERRSNKPLRIDNSVLPAGSDMHFYCQTCGHRAATLPECFIGSPPRLCEECDALRALGWLLE